MTRVSCRGRHFAVACDLSTWDGADHFGKRLISDCGRNFRRVMKRPSKSSVAESRLGITLLCSGARQCSPSRLESCGSGDDTRPRVHCATSILSTKLMWSTMGVGGRSALLWTWLRGLSCVCIPAAAQVVKSRFRHRIGLSLGAYTFTQARSAVSARLCTSGCFRQVRASGAGGTLRPPD